MSKVEIFQNYTEEGWQKNIEGSFDIYVQHGSEIFDPITVKVVNTPWYHHVYLKNYNLRLGEGNQAFIDVKNFGHPSEMVLYSCVYQLQTTTFSTDIHTLKAGEWYPDRSFHSICGSYWPEKVEVSKDNEDFVVVDIKPEFMVEPGLYAFSSYVVKKLPIFDFGSGIAWYEANEVWRARDLIQYALFVVLD